MPSKSRKLALAIVNASQCAQGKIGFLAPKDPNSTGATQVDNTPPSIEEPVMEIPGCSRLVWTALAHRPEDSEVCRQLKFGADRTFGRRVSECGAGAFTVGDLILRIEEVFPNGVKERRDPDVNLNGDISTVIKGWLVRENKGNLEFTYYRSPELADFNLKPQSRRAAINAVVRYNSDYDQRGPDKLIHSNGPEFADSFYVYVKIMNDEKTQRLKMKGTATLWDVIDKSNEEGAFSPGDRVKLLLNTEVIDDWKLPVKGIGKLVKEEDDEDDCSWRLESDLKLVKDQTDSTGSTWTVELIRGNAGSEFAETVIRVGANFFIQHPGKRIKKPVTVTSHTVPDYDKAVQLWNDWNGDNSAIEKCAHDSLEFLLPKHYIMQCKRSPVPAYQSNSSESTKYEFEISIGHFIEVGTVRDSNGVKSYSFSTSSDTPITVHKLKTMIRDNAGTRRVYESGEIYDAWPVEMQELFTLLPGGLQTPWKDDDLLTGLVYDLVLESKRGFAFGNKVMIAERHCEEIIESARKSPLDSGLRSLRVMLWRQGTVIPLGVGDLEQLPNVSSITEAESSEGLVGVRYSELGKNVVLHCKMLSHWVEPQRGMQSVCLER